MKREGKGKGEAVEIKIYERTSSGFLPPHIHPTFEAAAAGRVSTTLGYGDLTGSPNLPFWAKLANFEIFFFSSFCPSGWRLDGRDWLPPNTTPVPKFASRFLEVAKVLGILSAKLTNMQPKLPKTTYCSELRKNNPSRRVKNIVPRYVVSAAGLEPSSINDQNLHFTSHPLLCPALAACSPTVYIIFPGKAVKDWNQSVGVGSWRSVGRIGSFSHF